MKRRPPVSTTRQWRWPIVIAVLTSFGLLSALLGKGWLWWGLSWATLALPLLVIVRYWPLRRRH
jgi:hypothetical protein